MTAPLAQRPACAECGGKRIVVRAERDRALAAVCPACSGRCAVCGGAGVVIARGAEGYELSRPCECRLREARVRRFNAAHVPRSLAACTLESFKPYHPSQAEAHARVVDFVHGYLPGKDENRGLMLMGPVGVGKSHLLAASVRYLALEKGLRCRYAELFLLFREIRDGYKAGKSEGDVLTPLEEVEVLALDEVGKGRCSEFELQVLDDVVSRRYNANRTTLFATNYTTDARTSYRAPTATDSIAAQHVGAETLQDRVGYRIYSRLHQMCEMVPIDGPDYRTGGFTEARKSKAR